MLLSQLRFKDAASTMGDDKSSRLRARAHSIQLGGPTWSVHCDPVGKRVGGQHCGSNLLGGSKERGLTEGTDGCSLMP